MLAFAKSSNPAFPRTIEWRKRLEKAVASFVGLARQLTDGGAMYRIADPVIGTNFSYHAVRKRAKCANEMAGVLMRLDRFARTGVKSPLNATFEHACVILE
jgi:hypothetical protein